jgi:Fungal specific transcription factor domain
MYAIASRYDGTDAPAHLDPSMMWEAGDEHLDSAKVILDRTYASSRPSTCQSLLLMGYREIGIGAMAQAWTYIGMAIRMAQDLGMHRSADGWERVGLGGRLFNESELNERKRIWFGCVIMDKYVSTYIGLSFSPGLSDNY